MVNWSAAAILGAVLVAGCAGPGGPEAPLGPTSGEGTPVAPPLGAPMDGQALPTATGPCAGLAGANATALVHSATYGPSGTRQNAGMRIEVRRAGGEYYEVGLTNEEGCAAFPFDVPDQYQFTLESSCTYYADPVQRDWNGTMHLAVEMPTRNLCT